MTQTEPRRATDAEIATAKAWVLGRYEEPVSLDDQIVSAEYEEALALIVFANNRRADSPSVDEAIRTLCDAGITPAKYRAALREANPLPGWDEMSDLDKGCALLFDHKADSEGSDYAVENYPCRYRDDPRLVALDRRDASEHAAEVCGDDVFDRIGGEEYERLYDLALAVPAEAVAE